MAEKQRRPSFDITSVEHQYTPRPPSPAPTYCSTFHHQDYNYTPPQTHPSTSSSPSATDLTWEDEKPYKPHQVFPDEKHPKPHKVYPNEKAIQDAETEAAAHGDFAVKQDHHDPSHPHYIPPSSRTHYEPAPPKIVRPRRRYPSLLTLLPWLLASIFFLTTLWYTSIALGVRLFANLRPTAPSQPPSVNVIINENGNALPGTPVVSISTFISISTAVSVSTASATPSATPSATGRPDSAPEPGNDPQDNSGKPQNGRALQTTGYSSREAVVTGEGFLRFEHRTGVPTPSTFVTVTTSRT